MSEVNSKTKGFALPVMQGLLPINRSQIPAEIIAGITLAALAVPEVMGYTKIAGTPVIFGLYTMLIPTFLFAFFGSSRHLVVGAELDQAEAGLQQARTRLAQAQAELGAPGDENARILLARAKLADAELNLSYTKVTAVQDAFITGLNLPPGNYVSVGEPLFSLVTTTTWRITGNFLETDLARIKPGQEAVIRLQTYPDHRLKGVVEGISWGIEQQAGEVERGGLPDVTPTVDWVRLAQRFPVSVKFVDVPPEVKLRIGMNGNLKIDTTADSR